MLLISVSLNDLKFEAKKVIVRSVIDKMVGTKEGLQVYGYIPITNINVFTNNRNSWFTKCWKKYII